MSNICSARDLDFFVHEWLRSDELLQREAYADHSRDTFDALLGLAEEIATAKFATHNSLSDQHEPQFVDGRVQIIPEVKQALDAYYQAGFGAIGLDPEVGGMPLPSLVQRACGLWFQAANVATSGYPLLTLGAANLLLAHGGDELVQRFVPPMAEGRWFGVMCLSEPDVGSSLGDVTTRAVPAHDGTWRLSGTKMWISGGDHELSDNIIALVLARHEGGPAGVRGLSLYAVPKYLVDEAGQVGERNDVALVGINHKMGFRGTVNTVLEFGGAAYTPQGSSGAIGYLVGEVGRGLDCMFHMMNEARIGVGAGAAALAATSHLHAVDYARQRPQGRLAGQSSSEPMVAIIQHPDVRRMLLASKAYAEGSVALVLHAARLLDDQQTHPDAEVRADAGLLLDVLTPIVKSWPSQWGLVANDLAIQVHGGYGYTREFPVEQFYRDNRLNPIHEGTHGVQGKDLLGRKVMIANGRGLSLLVAEISGTIDKVHASDSVDPSLRADAARLAELVERLQQTTDQIATVADVEVRLANASAYLEAFGHLVVAWHWLDIALALAGRSDDFADGKRLAQRYFFDYEVPKVDAMLDLVGSGSRLLVDLDDRIL